MTHFRPLALLIVIGATLGVLQGCTGKRPFLTVQLCLGNEQNTVTFIHLMHSVANAEHMRFVDVSAANQKDLSELKADPGYRLIDISVERKDGMGMGAGNLGLSADEVAIGFSEGSNPAEARRFADTVVRELKKRWPVYIVPSGRGALPLKDCGIRVEKGSQRR